MNQGAFRFFGVGLLIFLATVAAGYFIYWSARAAGIRYAFYGPNHALHDFPEYQKLILLAFLVSLAAPGFLMRNWETKTVYGIAVCAVVGVAAFFLQVLAAFIRFAFG